MKRPSIWILAVVLAGAGLGCHPDITSLEVPLLYRPTNGSGGGLSLPSVKVYIAPVNDTRQDTTRIGENVENQPIPIYAHNPTAAQFVHQVFAEEFRNDGITVVDSPDAADRLMTVSIRRLWVTESDSYDAQVALGVKVTDKSGNIIAANLGCRGDDTTHGHSHTPENYQQVLSNSTANAINNLMQTPDFVKALGPGTGE